MVKDCPNIDNYPYVEYYFDIARKWTISEVKGWCHNERCGNQRASQNVNGARKRGLYSKSSYRIVRVSTFLPARCSPVHKARLYRSKLQLPNQWTYMVVLWQRTYIPFVSTCIRCHHQFRLGNYGLASLSYSFNFYLARSFAIPCAIFLFAAGIIVFFVERNNQSDARYAAKQQSKNLMKLLWPHTIGRSNKTDSA